jgi:hypothetical protein
MRAYNDSHNVLGSVNRCMRKDIFRSHPKGILMPKTEAGDQDKDFQVNNRQEGHEELEICKIWYHQIAELR